MDQPPPDSATSDLWPLSDEEAEIIFAIRRCSPRRQKAIKRIALKLADLERPDELIKLTTNIVQFKPSRDD